MDLADLNELIEFMNEHGLSELEIEQKGKRVRLKKGFDGQAVVVPVGAVAASGATPSAPPPASNLLEIPSPMVGTFYRAPNPESKPFMEVGDPVGPNDVVCIVEAMKVFNEVPAELSGTIQEICVEDGQPVEFGQVLFRVAP